MNSRAVQESIDTEEPWKAGRRVYLIVTCLVIVLLVVAIDATVLVPAFPTIAKDLHGSTSEAFWTGTSYLLTSSTFQPVLGALSAAFGRRSVFIASIILFTAGTLICCLAQNFPILLLGRTVQGIGSGGIITSNLVIITDVVPLRQRARYYAITQVSLVGGMIAGPLIGGAVAQYSSTWRWLFYINFPFCVAGLVTAPWMIRVDEDHTPALQRSNIRTVFGGIDWVGFGMFIASTVSFLIAITWGGHDYAWSAYQTLLPLLLGLAGIAVTMVWEFKYTKQPFIRPDMLRSRSLLTAYVCTCLQGLLLYAHIFYLALYLIGMQGKSPLLAGVYLLPIFGGLILASGSTGFALTHFGVWHWAVWIGWAINTLASGILMLLVADTSTAAEVFIFLTLGLGQGVLLISHNLAVQAIATEADVAYATTFYAFMRSVGFCLGIAIGGTIFENRLSILLRDTSLPPSYAQNIETYILEFVNQDSSGGVDAAIKEQVLVAFGKSLTFFFQIMTGISALGFLISLTITGHHSLDQKRMAPDEMTTNRASRGASEEEGTARPDAATKVE
ncbi:MFS general substrate transporter [Hyaloscypha variabilis F]|uniref:MFS general substrate transporter n=1 Tax=Hyaloscypha variabilis (strain UAMH 11265 / GT02V1 / F) TaxID=1149755 RepID=A0A2J6S7V6_HYAVF|nr:MFS general substrate transporter [Hyaloscypha variabilis F]